MVLFITLTTLIHAALFLVDEHLFHKKRGLNRKEINATIFDGVLFMGTVALTIFTKYTEQLSYAYILLGGLSCLSIIKNELYYPAELSVQERVVHGFLYVFHPLILFAFFSSWKINFFTTNMTYWMLQLGYLVLLFKGLSYHIIYWNYIHERKQA